MNIADSANINHGLMLHMPDGYLYLKTPSAVDKAKFALVQHMQIPTHDALNEYSFISAVKSRIMH